MDTLIEGIDASVQPCTLAVVLPAVATVFASGRRALVGWLGFVLGCSILFWARAAGYWDVSRSGVMQLVVAALAVAAFGAVYLRRRGDIDLTFGGAVVAGGLAGWLWRPCVGERLGDILNNASDEGVRTLSLTPLYVTGVTIVGLGLALVPRVWPRVLPVVERRGLRLVGLYFAVAYAALIAAGRYDDLVAELLQRSSA